MFFRPYTEKFLFQTPSQLHRDWGRAGVNRAVIDKRAHSDGLWALLKNTLLPKPVETSFIYAPTGVGRFSEILTERIERAGGRVLLERRVDAIEHDAGRIVALRCGDERFATQNVVWTAPITEANALLGIDEVELEYLSTIFYNLEIDAPVKYDFQWTYYGGDEIFSRVSAPTVFAESMAPKGQSGLCVEVTCREGDERWHAPEQHTQAVIDDLVRTGTIDTASQVRAVHIERVPFTYPIYKLELPHRADAQPARAGRVSEPPARRTLRALLVQQHGSLDRTGADHVRQDPARPDAGQHRHRGSRVLGRGASDRARGGRVAVPEKAPACGTPRAHVRRRGPGASGCDDDGRRATRRRAPISRRPGTRHLGRRRRARPRARLAVHGGSAMARWARPISPATRSRRAGPAHRLAPLRPPTCRRLGRGRTCSDMR